MLHIFRARRSRKLEDANDGYDRVVGRNNVAYD